MEKFERYNLEKAEKEALEIQKRARQAKEEKGEEGEPEKDDYENADRLTDEKPENLENGPESKLKKSFFEESILDSKRGDHLEPMNNEIQNVIHEKIQSFAEQLEVVLNEEDEELKYKITYIAPDSEKKINFEKKQIKDQIEDEAWKNNDYASSGIINLEEKFGPEFGKEFESLPKMERIKKLAEALMKKELERRVNYKTWTNITIYRKKKGDAKIISYYPNLNITEDGKIYTKGDGLLSFDEAIEKISSYLRRYIINKEF